MASNRVFGGSKKQGREKSRKMSGDKKKKNRKREGERVTNAIINW